MSKFEKLRQKILDGKSDANISFEDLRNFCSISDLMKELKEAIIFIEETESKKSRICSVTAAKQNLIKSDK